MVVLAQDESEVDAGLDGMLDDTHLNDIKRSIWRRYKMRVHPEIMPADSLASKRPQGIQA